MCALQIPKVGTLVLKHVGVLIFAHEVYLIKCICWWIVNCKNKHGMNNIKLVHYMFVLFLALQPNVGHSRLMLEVSRSYKITHHCQ